MGRKGSFLPKSVQTFFAGSTAGATTGLMSGEAGAVCAGVVGAGVATAGLESEDAAVFAAMFGVFVILIFFRETRQRYAVSTYVGVKCAIYKAFREVSQRIAR